jgi:hypothetical protein
VLHGDARCKMQDASGSYATIPDLIGASSAKRGYKM